jgi:hypothetical protein
VPFVAALILGAAAALTAVKLSNPLAAPLALFFVLFATAPRMLAQLVLTDLVLATLLLLEGVLLAFSRGPAQSLGAGLIAGFLVWVRLASLPLVPAGLEATRYRTQAVLHLATAVPVVLLLAAWQWATYGSPLTTGYQVVGAGPNGDGSVSSLFSIAFVTGPAAAADGPVHGGAAQAWQLPNLAFYSLELLGADSFLFRPGVGLIGLLGAIVFAARPPPIGAFSRFTLACTVLTLATYLPYFYQSGRFLAAPAALLSVVAAVTIARFIQAWALRRRVSPAPRQV